MIIVTGSNGFIGSNLIKELNKNQNTKILAVDDQKDPELQKNIADCNIHEFFDIDEFLGKVENGEFDNKNIEAIFHQGACSDTMEWDSEYLLKNNFYYSKTLLNLAERINAPFIYASSASVYGSGKIFKESKENEDPINLYAFSKYLFDQLVRKRLKSNTSQIAGMRYFNVYGPNESHKGGMASVAYHLHQQLKTGDKVKLFEGTDGYGNGEQRRDFIHVEDVVKVNTWLLNNSNVSGIFNVGTGRSQTFNEVAKAVLEWNQKGSLEYIPFPDKLQGSYQSYTEADISKLRNAGYSENFLDVSSGVKKYLDTLKNWPKNEY